MNPDDTGTSSEVPGEYGGILGSHVETDGNGNAIRTLLVGNDDRETTMAAADPTWEAERRRHEAIQLYVSVVPYLPFEGKPSDIAEVLSHLDTITNWLKGSPTP